MNNVIDATDIIELAKEFEVDQFDILETFICELLNISPDRLYEIIDEKLI